MFYLEKKLIAFIFFSGKPHLTDCPESESFPFSRETASFARKHSVLTDSE